VRACVLLVLSLQHNTLFGLTPLPQSLSLSHILAPPPPNTFQFPSLASFLCLSVSLSLCLWTYPSGGYVWTVFVSGHVWAVFVSGQKRPEMPEFVALFHFLTCHNLLNLLVSAEFHNLTCFIDFSSSPTAKKEKCSFVKFRYRLTFWASPGTRC